MKNENMKTKSTYTVGRTVVNDEGARVVEHEERAVAVTLATHEGAVFWKGARVA